jgi:hypothetical protein
VVIDIHLDQWVLKVCHFRHLSHSIQRKGYFPLGSVSKEKDGTAHFEGVTYLRKDNSPFRRIPLRIYDLFPKEEVYDGK